MCIKYEIKRIIIIIIMKIYHRNTKANIRKNSKIIFVIIIRAEFQVLL